MFHYPCVILAGGKSSRMGKDKALLPFGKEKSLVEYQVQRLKPLFESIHVSMKTKKVDMDISYIFDDEKKTFSPMVALKNILSNFKNTHVFIISVDTPFFGEKEIQELVSFTKNHDAIIPKDTQRAHPLCGFYHTKMQECIGQLINENVHTMKVLLDKFSTKYVLFSNTKAFLNVNHKEEYEKAKKLYM